MSRKNITKSISTVIPNEVINGTPAAKNYCKSFQRIKTEVSNYTTSKEFELKNPTLFSGLYHTIKDLIKSDFLYSHKEQTVMKNRKKGSDIEDDIIRYSNYDMTKSLTKSPEYNDDLILDILTDHIMLKSLYYIKNANTYIHSYNLIKVSISHKLIDMVNSYNRHMSHISFSLDSVYEDEDGNYMLRDIISTDKHYDTDFMGTVANAKSSVIHKVIHHFISDNKAHRMLAYIANVADISNDELCDYIVTYGYEETIKRIVDELKFYSIDVSYLQTMNLQFPKHNTDVTNQMVASWKASALTQVRKYISTFK